MLAASYMRGRIIESGSQRVDGRACLLIHHPLGPRILTPVDPFGSAHHCTVNSEALQLPTE
jgi:hypothetical protein